MSKRKNISQRQAMKWRKALNELKRTDVQHGTEIAKFTIYHNEQFQAYTAARSARICKHIVLAYPVNGNGFVLKAYTP